MTSKNIDPKAGQIIVRPRNAAPALPAVGEIGKLVPILKPGPYWIVHVMGTITGPAGRGYGARKIAADPPPAYYWSGLLTLVDDESAKMHRSVYMP